MAGNSVTRAGSTAFTAGLILLLAWIYGPVAVLYAREHWSSATLEGAYAHAPLLIALVAWLIWQRRDALRAPAGGTACGKGLMLLALGAALRIYGDIEGYVVLQGMSLLPLVAGILLVLSGEHAWRAMRFPVLMLLFVIPLPNAAIDAVTRPLLDVTADFVVLLLPLFDIGVGRNAQLLTVSALGDRQVHEVLIAPECSGIRSLVTLLAIGSLMAGLRGYAAWRTALLLLAVPLLTLVGNVTRILITILLIVHVDPDTARGFFHSASGLVLFAVSLFGMFALDRVLGRHRNGRDS
jgi:exosortase